MSPLPPTSDTVVSNSAENENLNRLGASVKDSKNSNASVKSRTPFGNIKNQHNKQSNTKKNATKIKSNTATNTTTTTTTTSTTAAVNANCQITTLNIQVQELKKKLKERVAEVNCLKATVGERDGYITALKEEIFELTTTRDVYLEAYEHYKNNCIGPDGEEISPEILSQVFKEAIDENIQLHQECQQLKEKLVDISAGGGDFDTTEDMNVSLTSAIGMKKSLDEPMVEHQQAILDNIKEIQDNDAVEQQSQENELVVDEEEGVVNKENIYNKDKLMAKVLENGSVGKDD